PGRRLRRRILLRRRRRVRRDLPHRRVSRGCRTLTIGKRRACLVLFRRARGGRDCAPDGLRSASFWRRDATWARGPTTHDWTPSFSPCPSRGRACLSSTVVVFTG